MIAGNEDTTHHRRQLIEALRRRLRVLEIKAAKYGLECPASIEIEIDEIREKIGALEQDVFDLSGLSDALNQLCYIEQSLDDLQLKKDKIRYQLIIVSRAMVEKWDVPHEEKEALLLALNNLKPDIPEESIHDNSNA